MASYGAARGTVRQAIAALRAQGLVDVQHGRGAFVRTQPPVRRLAHDRFARRHRKAGKAAYLAELEAEGRRPDVEVLAIEPVPATSEIAGRRPYPAQLRGLDPYASPYASPYAGRWRTPGFGGRGDLSSSDALRGASRPQKPRPTGPPRGSGASARQGALRAIDSFRRSRSWRTCGPRRLWRHLSLPWLPRTVSSAWTRCGHRPASGRVGWLNRRGPLPAAAPAPALATRPSAALGASRTKR